MLRAIQVKDFAIVEVLALEFEDGMTAMTGETGAGKSILVDALGLVLGERADSTSVRAGAQRAEITATFDLAGMSHLQDWLRDRELDADEECFLRRVVSSEGRSRAYVNGTPVPVQLMRELGDYLVDIHGQHEHQTLLHRDRQREILDDWAENGKLVAVVAECHSKWRALRSQLETLRTSGDERRERLQLLEFQVQELEALGLQPGELEVLDEEHARLANAGRILEGCQSALNVLYECDDASAHHQLTRAGAELETLAAIDSRLSKMVQVLDEAAIQVREASNDLRHYAMDVEMDPQRLLQVEARIATVQDLARKHRVEPRDLTNLLETIGSELDGLRNANSRMEGLSGQLTKAEKAYRNAAVALSTARETAAEQLSARIAESIQGLGMPGGQFEISVATRAGATPTAKGLDSVEFLVSANPGQPARALNKVASGGELSRVSLAVQLIARNASRVPTLIFDEVDSGIGGGTAEVVGRLLRRLGQQCQVMCVTHLPQVASQAHHHYKIDKITHADRTESEVSRLDPESRVREVARMLGGVEVTESTLTHAREMIAQAENSRGEKIRPDAGNDQDLSCAEPQSGSEQTP